jgi:hypothetical protein
MGTRVPIVLTRRADSVRTRLASTAVLALVAHATVFLAISRRDWERLAGRHASSRSQSLREIGYGVCGFAALGPRFSEETGRDRVAAYSANAEVIFS